MTASPVLEVQELLGKMWVFWDKTQQEEAECSGNLPCYWYLKQLCSQLDLEHVEAYDGLYVQEASHDLWSRARPRSKDN